MRVNFRFTNDYDPALPNCNYGEIFSVTFDPGYDFDDFLSDKNVAFDKAGDDEYIVLDDFGEPTGERYLVVSIDMKLYEKMNYGENLGWCIPYFSEDGTKGFTKNGDDIRVFGDIGVKSGDYSANEVEELIDKNDLREGGCSECPFRDECDAMDNEL